MEKFNAFVHSSVSSMIHSGHDTGEWRGLCFKLDEVHRWCGLVAECVEVGIHLAKIQTEIWLKTLNSNPDICTICHSKNNFEKKQVHSAGKDPLSEFICKKCGHKWHRSQSLKCPPASIKQIIRQNINRRRATARRRGAGDHVLRHPNAVVAPDRLPPLIYSLPQKVRAIESLGTDSLLLIHFD